MTTPTPRRVLVLGYGRLGRAFCRLYHSTYQIRGVKRTPIAPSADSPCEVVCLPIRDDALRPHLAWADVVLFCPASGRSGVDRETEQDSARYRETYLGNMESVTARLQEPGIRPPVVILVGSTGVYPRSIGGVWSEERSIPVDTPRQKVLLQTEQALIRSGLPYVILRCGGLYGEGRNPLAWIGRRAESSGIERSDDPLSLVHQDDVCGVIDRVIATGVTNDIFNVRDDSLFTRGILAAMVAAHAAEPLADRAPAPAPQAPPDRLIPNDKLKRRLAYRFSRPPVTAYLTTSPAIS